MKFGQIKKFLKEGNLLSIDDQLLQALGNRYIHKYKSWWKNTDKNDDSLAHELINFKNRPESRRPKSSDREGQSIECCYKLLDVLKGVGASPGYPENNWLASKIVDILNTVFTKEPDDKVKLGDYSIGTVINHFKGEIDHYASQTVSTGPHNKVKFEDYSIEGLIRYLKDETDGYDSQTVAKKPRDQAKLQGYKDTLIKLCKDKIARCDPKMVSARGTVNNMPAIQNAIDKQARQQLEKQRLITNFLKNTSVKSGGEEVYFNNQSYCVPKGVLEAFRSSNQLLDRYNSNRKIIEIDNRLSPKDLKAMISYFMKSYAKENNGSQQRFHIGGWGKRSEETMVMYQHFQDDQSGYPSKYFENRM
ncbi:hypothetical protein [Piscirickettsia salmonis]|uniref:hypothetical protein n=1 Tax=Piscirickettsia salmonis TaxID=1238 RepID=UPI0007D7F063|nr:hypothetical protein A0O36_00963 [Piscirickettsiaceae bacterium NZ-RLO1]